MSQPTMSATMQASASFEAGFLGAIWKHYFHRVPPVPSHISLQGQTAIVTGSSGGLGLECARQFLQQGLTHLILAVRSQSKGDAAAEQLLAEYPGAKIEVWLLDMESYASVRGFADRCRALAQLDVAILNAGCGKTAFQRTDGGRGRETSLQVNYLSTVLLAALLVPILKVKAKTLPGRLSVVGSDTAYMARVKEPVGGESVLDAADSERGFDGFGQYGKTKLFLVMAVSRLAGFVGADSVVVNYVNPSGVRGTDLMRDTKGAYLTQAFVYVSNVFFGRNLVDGTRQYLHSALVLGKESHGSWTDFKIRPYPPIMYTDAGRRTADKLWDETLAEVGISDIQAAVQGTATKASL